MEGADCVVDGETDWKFCESSPGDFQARLLIPAWMGEVISQSLTQENGCDIRQLEKDFQASISISPSGGGPERVLTVRCQDHGSCCRIIQAAMSFLVEGQGQGEVVLELRLLVDQGLVERILEKLKEGLKRLPGTTARAFPSCAPQSSERVISLHGPTSCLVQAIGLCLQVDSAEDEQGSTVLYNPANTAWSHKYGGWKEDEVEEEVALREQEQLVEELERRRAELLTAVSEAKIAVLEAGLEGMEAELRYSKEEREIWNSVLEEEVNAMMESDSTQSKKDTLWHPMEKESESVEIGPSEANTFVGEPPLPIGQRKVLAGHLVAQDSEFRATAEETCGSSNGKMFVDNYSSAAIDVLLATNNSITAMKTELAARKSLVGPKPNPPVHRNEHKADRILEPSDLRGVKKKLKLQTFERRLAMQREKMKSRNKEELTVKNYRLKTKNMQRRKKDFMKAKN